MTDENICEGCGEFDPSKIEPTQLLARAGQEPEISLRVSDWNAFLADWLRMKEIEENQKSVIRQLEAMKKEDKKATDISIHRVVGNEEDPA